MKKLVQIFTLELGFAGTACHDLEQSKGVDNSSASRRTIAEQVCSNCHGVTGVPRSPAYPKLASHQQEYLVAQLTDF